MPQLYSSYIYSCSFFSLCFLHLTHGDLCVMHFSSEGVPQVVVPHYSQLYKVLEHLLQNPKLTMQS